MMPSMRCSVEIVPEGEALKVTSFGPMKLQSGSLPDWLKYEQ